MSRAAYEGLLTHVKTREGAIIAAGGICQKGYAADWQRQLQKLESIPFRMTSDLFDIDYTLACALKNIAEDTLLLVGASVRLPVQLSVGQSTGGVLGDPRMEITSSDGVAAAMENGFSLYTRPGGPGIAVSAGPEAAKRLAKEAKTGLGKPWWEKHFCTCVRECGADMGILVFDGTGTATGGVAVFTAQQAEVLLI